MCGAESLCACCSCDALLPADVRALTEPMRSCGAPRLCVCRGLCRDTEPRREEGGMEARAAPRVAPVPAGELRFVTHGRGGVCLPAARRRAVLGTEHKPSAVWTYLLLL